MSSIDMLLYIFCSLSKHSKFYQRSSLKIEYDGLKVALFVLLAIVAKKVSYFSYNMDSNKLFSIYRSI